MHSTSEELQMLARRMGQDKVSCRAELEAKLTPLLSLVLQTGRASPSLLQWVRQALPIVAPRMAFGGQADPEWESRHLARMLCSQLLRDIRAQRDSVVNRQTIVND